jgi:hypothetical protein
MVPSGVIGRSARMDGTTETHHNSDEWRARSGDEEWVPSVKRRRCDQFCTATSHMILHGAVWRSLMGYALFVAEIRRGRIGLGSLRS